MAIRNVYTKDDEALRKVCRPVEKFDGKLAELLDDMKETLLKANGVGLAAPQVGIVRRVAIVDTGEEILELINPEIISKSGKKRGIEGCLSCPKEWGYVTRPLNCTVRAQDRNGNYYEKELTEMTCRCACHEVDHLDGRLFIDIADEMVDVKEETD